MKEIYSILIRENRDYGITLFDWERATDVRNDDAPNLS
jgi:hypothetical protein